MMVMTMNLSSSSMMPLVSLFFYLLKILMIFNQKIEFVLQNWFRVTQTGPCGVPLGGQNRVVRLKKCPDLSTYYGSVRLEVEVGGLMPVRPKLWPFNFAQCQKSRPITKEKHKISKNNLFRDNLKFKITQY